MANEFTNIIQLPYEIFIEIFKKLDCESLCNLNHVSRYFKHLSTDNQVWMNLSINRWKDKQGIKDIVYNESEIGCLKDLLSIKHGSWKELYGKIESEAKRNKLKDDDLCETSWSFKFSLYTLSYNIGKPKFHRNGIYTHNGVMNGVFVVHGEVVVGRFPPLAGSRLSEDWSLQLMNFHVTFNSTNISGFRKVIIEFANYLIKTYCINIQELTNYQDLKNFLDFDFKKLTDDNDDDLIHGFETFFGDIDEGSDGNDVNCMI
ncbi:5603_t:CDS:2 [Entrophospora sp. SA101]|nr:1889_t:CDS:2 [Entrophospora sp. SA101]CAJ0632986.1 5601_t:CDS:2 [Entrophospora sp. SA101]CAJ0632989.1 5603_t:CDS:2 [Entrophospora sp. SA101]CAJ0841988.1 622_t:CDS:2 [Entrophospora sp. SA101]CAJ0908839.1 1259_t:CDS:2 [Entrophospora sp. SA101]